MWTSSRAVVARGACLAVIAATACACASATRESSRTGRDAGTSLAFPPATWLNSSLGSESAEASPTAGRAARTNAAATPDDHWLGMLGLRHSIAADWELGMGVSVPNLFTSNAQQTASDRGRDLGVGVWLKLDF